MTNMLFGSIKSAALYWFAFGFSVIPVLPKTKVPAVPWDPWLENLSSEMIEHHWCLHPDHELGFIAGENFLVLDADTPESVAALGALEAKFGIASNLVVKTTRGEHHYYRLAEGTIAKADSHSTEIHPTRLDVKTGRSMIILPPSTGKILLSGVSTANASCTEEITEIGQDFIDAVFIHNGNSVPRNTSATLESQHARQSPRCDMRMLRATVFCFDPDCGYDEWARIGMVISNETGQSDDGFALFNDWSRTACEKYDGIAETKKKWRSFERNPSNPVRIGTLFWMLSKQGISREKILAEAEPFQKNGGLK